MLVVLPEAVGRKNTDQFQRSDWIDSINCNIIILKDATINPHNDLHIGWFQGRHDSYAIPDVATLVKMVTKKLGVSLQDTLVYGSSAGGFSALQVGNYLPECLIYALNPQIYINRYNKAHFKRIADYCYSGETQNNILEHYGDRVSVSFDLAKRISPAVIKQNTKDEQHYMVHLTPFLFDKEHKIIHGSGLDDLQKLNIILYSDSNGHSPLHKDIEIPFINKLLSI
jgi:hypothetical protein